MRIKRLDITGFKSFMDHMVFSFDDGITGVVGPNGCGKSNVVDAIRWVMGEQSAKNLRGRGMEDVIFNGSETQPPLNMAEVSLTFKVEERDILAPQYAGYPEITVTRRLFRSGESEYLINKTICRLLDVTELFLGTGVGTKAYSIIEQGRVGLIVSSKPEDRRSLIEEAAGITKYKARRRAAERKMEYTQQNLLRVTDITKELESRLDSLARQAKKAEKYKKLRAEAREIELHTASHRFLELHAEAKVLQARLENLSGEEREGLDRLRASEADLDNRRAVSDAQAGALETLSAEVHALESQVKLDAQSLEHWEKDIRETQARIDTAQAERASLVQRREELVTSTAAREQELMGLAGSYREDEEAMIAAGEELRRLTERQLELSTRLELERHGLMQVTSRLANHESNLLNLARQKADLQSRRGKLAVELEAARAEEAALDKSRAEVALRLEETQKSAHELAERKGQEEEVLQRTRQAFAENEILVISSREGLSDKRSRLTSLVELQRNYEGFDRGVRAVMVKAGEGHRSNGIFGLVADVVSAAPRFEKAIEAALGAALQHVVVESRAKGFELIDYLKSHTEGRSTFLPVDALPTHPELAEPDLTRPGVLGAAYAEVQCEDALRPVVTALLGDVVIVTDLGCARSYAAETGGRYTLVTLDGEVLHRAGPMTGGALEGAAIGALQKKREISELSEDVRAAEERYNEILTRHYTLQKQISQLEGVLKGLAKNQHAEELNLANHEKDLHRAGADLSRLRDRIGALQTEEEQFQQNVTGLEAEEEASRGEVAHGQADHQRREEQVKEITAELESLKQRAADASASLTSLRVKVAAGSERGEAARKELEQLVASRSELEGRIDRLEATLAEGLARAAELSARLEEGRASREGMAADFAARGAELEGRRKDHAEEVARMREDEVALRELREKLDSVTQGVSQISLKEKELALELSHLISQVEERHQAQLHEHVQNYHLQPLLGPEAEVRLRDLRAQLEKMGEINLTAIEEHAEIAKRFDFLNAQKLDLESSQAQLTEAIHKIDKTSRERFKQTFDVVNDKFQQVYPRLFGGGRASLVLTEDAGGGEPGVEILAQPPGKKLQSVGLLSGGEKALTAVALIFGIFLIKPTPFCLLDEVDAPLDEGNVGRYNEMVREMSSQSQFILITHNKRTMEIVDTIYGVTMEEPGISKLVSVKMKEAVPAANDNQAA